MSGERRDRNEGQGGRHARMESPHGHRAQMRGREILLQDLEAREE